MAHNKYSFAVILVLMLACARAHAASQNIVNIDELRREVEELRQQTIARDGQACASQRDVNIALTDRFGPDAPVATHSGDLQIGGLVQVWYYNIQNDPKSWENAVAVQGSGPTTFGSNGADSNSGFAVRRAELTFDLKIHENISAFVMVDPAAETLRPSFPSNQGIFTNAGFVPLANVPLAGCLCTATSGNPRNGAVQNGSGLLGPFLQEAYINYHDEVPHHDFSIGQLKRRIGEEGYRDDGALDFAERAMITQPARETDLGLQMHGTWYCDRVQYWLGVFDGAGTAFQRRAARADDNSSKDVLGSLALRPVWDDCFWGSLEFGDSYLRGLGGQSGPRDPINNPVNGLNRLTTDQIMHYAWLYYAPGGALRGSWLRGEWGQIQDRFAPGEVVTGLFNYTTAPAPFNIQGWLVSAGYKLSNSVYSDSIGSWFKPLEFTFRHEEMQNLFYHDLVETDRRLDAFWTRVFTAGINYYIMGNNAKLQINYNWVGEQHDSLGDRQVREVRNNNLILGFQVGF